MRFCSLIGLRKHAPCPYCYKLLVWSKWPFRVLGIGSYLLIIYVVLRMAGIQMSGISRLLVWVPILLVPLSASAMKLELSDSGAKDRQRQ